MATKRKRGSSWTYTVRKSCLPKPIYLTFADEAEGDLYVAKLERLLAQGIVPPEFAQDKKEKAKKLSEMIRDYMRVNTISPQDEQILSAFDAGSVDSFQMDAQWAMAVVANMKDKKLAPGTIRHQVGALARCLDYAVYQTWMPKNPLRNLPRGYSTYKGKERVDESRDRRLSDQEIQRVWSVLKGEYKPANRQRHLELEQREAHQLLFTLALETAMRLSEMYTLEKRQVRLDQRTIFLEKTKNGNKRQIPLSSVAMKALERWEIKGELLFPFYDGDKPRTTARLSRSWARIFDHAECEDARFHDLRHTAVCKLYENTTLSDVQIALITGHTDLRMLKRYANLRGSDLAGYLP